MTRFSKFDLICAVLIFLTAPCAAVELYPTRFGTTWTYAEFYRNSGRPELGITGVREIKIVYSGTLHGDNVIVRQKRDFLAQPANPFPIKQPILSGLSNEIIVKSGKEVRSIANFYHDLDRTEKGLSESGVATDSPAYRKLLKEMELATKEIIGHYRKDREWLWTAAVLARGLSNTPKGNALIVDIFYPAGGTNGTPHKATVDLTQEVLIKYPLVPGAKWASGSATWEFFKKGKTPSTLGNRTWDTVSIGANDHGKIYGNWFSPNIGEVAVMVPSDKPGWEDKVFELISMKAPK